MSLGHGDQTDGREPGDSERHCSQQQLLHDNPPSSLLVAALQGRLRASDAGEARRGELFRRTNLGNAR
jgi:hypothetical protein